MDRNQEKQRELSLSNIVNVILKRLKLLIVVLIVGVILGGCFGFFISRNTKSYGAKIDYELHIIATTETKFRDGTSSVKSEPASNYIYKEQHVSMLCEHLKSDLFLCEILKYVNNDVVEAVCLTDASGNKYVALDSPDVEESAKQTFASYISFLKNALTFSFDYELHPNAFSATVSVTNSPERAKTLVAAVRKLIPVEVSGSENKTGAIIVPETSTSINQGTGEQITTSYHTECTQMSLNRSQQLNTGVVKKKTILFAALFGFFAAIVTVVILVILDSQDERIRDYNEFSKEIGLPVLSVIPNVEEFNFLTANEPPEVK